jgi:hypothetical protein
LWGGDAIPGSGGMGKGLRRGVCGLAGWCGGMLVFAGGWLNSGGGRLELIHVSQVVESGGG